MDDGRLGASLRALRRSRGMRQRDVAAAAATQQSLISELEAGRLSAPRVGVVRSVFAALGAELTLVPVWHGGGLDRLLGDDQ